MKRRFLTLALPLVLLLGSFARAATVHGNVNNGTSGKPAAGIEVILIQLQGGMQPVARTKSDAAGQFSFDNPNIGVQPMLIRAVYKDVNFHQPLPPGKDSVAIDVFEPSGDARLVRVPSHVVIFQPNGDKLTVGEEYAVNNDAKPPQAFFKTAGNFEVILPDGADLKQIAASGPSGMPVVQAPIDHGKNHYAIAFAFRPGESAVRLSYELPYANNAATVRLPTSYGGGRLLVVAPPSVQLTGDGLQMAGQEQGMAIYERPQVDAGTVVSVSLSGSAPPMAAGASGGADGGAPGRAENVQGEGQAIQAIPGRLDGVKWPLLGGFAAFFALFAFLLARKPVVGTAEIKAVGTPASPGSSESASHDALAALDRTTAGSLDALKDQLFRLELRRQAGTIGDDEYASERAKAEQILRELVRG